MAARMCLDCGRPTRTPPRCTECQARHAHHRNASRPHYDQAWRALSQAAREAEPWCHNPECPYPDRGTPTNPLTTDHVAARSLEAGVTVLCRRCNAAKGNRGGRNG